MYLPTERRLETVAEFENRVKQDYLNNINDLKDNLGVTADYLAIPMNDYGLTPVSNVANAPAFNEQVIKKYFRLAFVEANSPGIDQMILPVYNYRNDDPYSLRRVEVVEMSQTVLKNVLDQEFPTSPDLYILANNTKSVLQDSSLKYGYMSSNGEGNLRLRALAANASAKIQFGDPHWDNYDISIEAERKTGRSVFLSLFSSDEKNYVAFGLTDNGLFLREKIKGVDRELRPSVLLPVKQQTGFHNYRVIWRNGKITAYFDGQPIFANVPISQAEGTIGIKVWSDREVAESLIKWVKVTPVQTSVI